MPPIAEMLAGLAAVGGSIAPGENGTLAVRVPRSAAGLGRELLARKAEVLAHLAAPTAWDAVAAVRRMEAADVAVERHGCGGAEPAIRAAAERACEAYRRQDGNGLARACAEVIRLAARPAGAAPGSDECGQG